MGNPECIGKALVSCVNCLQNMENCSSISKPSSSDHTCLYLQSQEIKNFPFVNLHQLGTHITCVNINYNRISKLPNGLAEQMPGLKYLLANGNDISVLPDDFGNFGNLEILSICENNLTNLPETLCNLKNLKVLKINAIFLNIFFED